MSEAMMIFMSVLSEGYAPIVPAALRMAAMASHPNTVALALDERVAHIGAK